MDYTLNQLEIFHKVAELQSVTRAAEALHLTQPAVSIQLRNFQDQFDIPLTEVVGRKLYVTDFGKEIAAAAEKILYEVYAINYKTLAHKGQLAGRLKISVVSTGKYVMPWFLADFVRENTGVELVMDVTNKTKVVESLERNEVDFSLVSVIPDNMAVSKVDLLENKLFLVGNRNVKARKQVDLDQVLEHPFIFREPGSGTRQAMERFIERNRLKVVKRMELTSNEAVKQAVLAGLGYSVMPLIGIKNEIGAGTMKILPVKGLPIRTMWSLIWLKGKRLSPVASAFADYVQKEKHGIIARYFSDLPDLK